MIADLPIRLKVTGRDEFDGPNAVSTSFRFHGWLRVEGESLRIEWTGVAHVQAVGPLELRDSELRLPTETVIVPATRLLRAELAGGWWRPRLELQGRDAEALALVPSEERGRVRCWYERRDRAVAVQLQAALAALIAGARGQAPTAITHLSDSTPITPVTPPRP